MESRSFALLAGLFTILLGIALAATFVWLRGDTRIYNSYLVVSKFPVNGLKPQAVVRFRGVEIGRVDDISIDPRDSPTVLIRIFVEKGVPITRGTFARLGAQGLTGIAHIALDDDGSNPAPLRGQPGEPARIVARGNAFDDLTLSSNALLQQAAELLDRLNKIASDSNQSRIETALTNFEKASAQLEPALRAIPELSERAKNFLNEDNQRSLQRSLANIEQATNSIAPAIEDSRKMLANMRQLSEGLDKLSLAISSEITDSTLPKVNQLIDQLGQDTQDVHRLILQIEREPQSLLLGRERPRPGPGEPGFNGGQR